MTIERNIGTFTIIAVVVIIAGTIIGTIRMEIGPFDTNETDDGSSEPVAVITKNRTNADPGEEISFDGSGSYDEVGTITGYQWDFGDGHVCDGPMTNHSWDAPGCYDVSLTVTNTHGYSNITWARIGIVHREHHEGTTDGETVSLDFSMERDATRISVNTTLQNGDDNIGENDVTIRIAFNGTVVDEQSVNLFGASGNAAIDLSYVNDTDLSEGNWNWELVVNDSGLVCDLNWEVEVVIVYA